MSCQLFGFEISCSASDFNVFQLVICMELAKWQIFKFHYLRCVLIAKTDRIELKNQWMEEKKAFCIFLFSIFCSASDTRPLVFGTQTTISKTKISTTTTVLAHTSFCFRWISSVLCFVFYFFYSFFDSFLFVFSSL